MSRALLLAAIALALAPSLAQAQRLGQSLATPERDAPAEGGAAESTDRAADEASEGEASEGAEGEEDESSYPGPQIQLLYGYTKIADGYGGGDAHTASLAVFIQWPVHELRTGIVAEAGSRDYSLAGDDLFVRGGLELGFQLPQLLDPFVPHISALLSFGALVGERFDTTVAHGFAGGGIELGAELAIVRNFHVAAAFAYQRLEMDGAAFDLLMVRLGLGL